MQHETKERWRELCERVVVEEDPNRSLAAIQELLEVLEDNEESGAIRQAYERHSVNTLPRQVGR